MRGIIFNSYSEFIINTFDSKTLDTLLQSDEYPNKGGFSALGNYKSSYMLSLINNSTYLFKCSRDEILRQFGKFSYGYLHERLKKMYLNDSVILNFNNPYDFLENLNTLHFEELQKIYPKAKFPEFHINRLSSEHIILKYASFRNLPYLSYGLIEGCIEYYKYNSTVTMTKTEQLRTISGKEYPVYLFEVKSNG